MELPLLVVLVALAAAGLAALRRPDLAPPLYWLAGWVAAATSGLLVLAEGELPRLHPLTHPLGALFPWLLLAGALAYAGRRVPGWLLPAALASGAARLALDAEVGARPACALALAVEPPVVLAAACRSSWRWPTTGWAWTHRPASASSSPSSPPSSAGAAWAWPRCRASPAATAAP